MNFSRILPALAFVCVFGAFIGIAASLSALRFSTTPRAYAEKILGRSDGRVRKALFSPRDPVTRVLKGLIDAEQRSIKIAIFTLTDTTIVDSLVAAYKRGVTIEIVADGESSTTEYSKIPALKKAGIPTYLFKPRGDRQWRPLMHDKFIIFGETIFGKSLIWTGSFNITRSANERNRENVLILDDAELIADYTAEMEALKLECRQPKAASPLQQSTLAHALTFLNIFTE
jgi:phosphatidylserine/phosphatidylglycerophosphate/cardiolipin synthase-like enzyme